MLHNSQIYRFVFLLSRNKIEESMEFLSWVFLFKVKEKKERKKML